jgi:hypothetical protein
MLSRALAVASAVCLVAAFTIATLLPPLNTLAEALADLDHPFLVWLKDTVQLQLSDWVWLNLFVPVLVRPDWLILACLGVVFAGAALTLSSRKGVTRSHRRRS